VFFYPSVPEGAVAVKKSGPNFEKPDPDVEKPDSDFGKSDPDFKKSGPDFKKSDSDFEKSGPNVEKSGRDAGFWYALYEVITEKTGNFTLTAWGGGGVIS
jgi:hypothetical protein